VVLDLNLSDLLPCNTVAASRVRQALHVDSFDPAAVRHFCMPWLLDPFCFLSPCLRSVCVAVCSVLFSCVLLVGASAAEEAVPVDDRPFAGGLLRMRCLQPLSLPPSSRVAERSAPSFRPSEGAEAEALLG
jgi:hypothetical protein